MDAERVKLKLHHRFSPESCPLTTALEVSATGEVLSQVQVVRPPIQQEGLRVSRQPRHQPDVPVQVDTTITHDDVPVSPDVLKRDLPRHHLNWLWGMVRAGVKIIFEQISAQNKNSQSKKNQLSTYS